jgi:hypothetical protein
MLSTAADQIRSSVTSLNDAMFKGDDNSIQVLSHLLGNGSFLSSNAVNNTNDAANMVTKAMVYNAIFAYWDAIKLRPVVVDANAACDGPLNPLDQTVVPVDVQQQSWTCIDNSLYYLLGHHSHDPCLDNSSDGEGVSSCPVVVIDVVEHANGMGDWVAPLTRDDFIIGAVASWKAFGQKLGWHIADMTQPNAAGFFSFDVRAPYANGIPVCSLDE